MGQLGQKVFGPVFNMYHCKFLHSFSISVCKSFDDDGVDGDDKGYDDDDNDNDDNNDNDNENGDDADDDDGDGNDDDDEKLDSSICVYNRNTCS